jgi:hypothetical protein
MGFSSNEEENIWLTLQVTNSLSLFGSSGILFFYFCYPSSRSYALKLVLYMSTADILRSVGFLLPTSPRYFCLIQAVLTNFGSLSSLIWTSIIAFSIFSVVILEVTNIQKHEKYMLFLGYFVPIVLVWFPFITDSYGKDGGWCWLRNDKWRLLWSIGDFYAIVVIIVIVNIFTYYRVISEIRFEIGLLLESPHDLSNKAMLFNRFSLYPLIIVICYLPILTERIYELATNESIYWLTLFSAAMTSIIGFLNAFVYGFTNNVLHTLSESCCRKRTYSSFSQEININPDTVFSTESSVNNSLIG